MYKLHELNVGLYKIASDYYLNSFIALSLITIILEKLSIGKVVFLYLSRVLLHLFLVSLASIFIGYDVVMLWCFYHLHERLDNQTIKQSQFKVL